MVQQLKTGIKVDMERTTATSLRPFETSAATAASQRKDPLLDEVEAAVRHWENVRFLELPHRYQHKAMLWHIVSVEAARAFGCSTGEITEAIKRAAEPLPISGEEDGNE